MAKRVTIDEVNVYGAYLVASRYHLDQRYGRHSYMYHLTQVVDMCKRVYKHDEKLTDILMVAWLHDIVEDTDIQDGRLRDLVEPHIFKSIMAITNTNTFKDTLKNITGNETARKVKLVDRYCNMYETLISLRCHNEYGDDFNKHMVRKYLRQYPFMTEILGGHDNTKHVINDLDNVYTALINEWELYCKRIENTITNKDWGPIQKQWEHSDSVEPYMILELPVSKGSSEDSNEIMD